MALEDPPYAPALDARYGGQERPGAILWNETIATLLGHKSVRSFLPKPLPDGALQTLVAAAQSAASSSNLQLWSVIAVTDRGAKGKLAALASNQRHIDDAPLILLWVADHARVEAIGKRAEQPTDGLDYLDSFLTAAVDASLAAQNCAIAAESLGLGTVYIGALRNKPAEVAEVVILPARATVLFGLVVGWPDPDRPAEVKPRLPQSVVLHHEFYSADDQHDLIEQYDRASRAFQERQGLPVTGWRAPLLARSADAAALHGRDRLRDVYAEQGLPLR